MTSIHLDTYQDKYMISIDMKSIDKAWVLKFIEKLRMEELAQQFDFEEDIESLGEEIKESWWLANKKRFINE